MSPSLEINGDRIASNDAMAGATDEPSRVVRRKFATPPVKLACLSCRASRTRCDGGHPCASCVTKGNECVYRPSRRGGPRVRKKAAPNALARPVADIRPQETETVVPEIPEHTITVQQFIDPGAGLAQLPDLPQDSDFIFDSLFPVSFPEGVFDDVTLPQTMLPVPISGPLARTYRSDISLLNAYYCWIHPYIPILPPPEMPPVDEPFPLSQNMPTDCDQDFEPTTPLALALSAVLALIPCAEDTDPTSPESILFRRKCAQFFAQSAIECIEAEGEMPDSSTEPSKALESSPPPFDRPPFHPRVPVELESIIALDLLSTYEYAQRGNLKKMKSRAGQALMDAMMNHNLHMQTDDDDFFIEAKRRVWWMTVRQLIWKCRRAAAKAGVSLVWPLEGSLTPARMQYVCATQSSIVSNTPPPVDLYKVPFTTKFPTLDLDPEAWPDFIGAQKAILTATQFVVQLNKELACPSNMEPIYQKMIDLENELAPLVDKSDNFTFTGSLAPQVDPSESALVRSLRAMAKIKLNSARIKIHRYCAFYDYPVFTGKVCDLKVLGEIPSDGNEPLSWPSCSCSPQTNSTKTGSPESSHVSSTASPRTSADSTPLAHSAAGSNHTGASDHGHDHDHTALTKVPFSSHHSAKICLRSALGIAQGFDNLPYPNPAGQFGQDICFLSPTSPIVAPRMLPSFVCCAMQGAYVFLSIYRKTQSLRPGTNSSSGYLVSMLLQLQRGLTSILAALENYATAFEALRSMRDQIRLSADSLIGIDA